MASATVAPGGSASSSAERPRASAYEAKRRTVTVITLISNTLRRAGARPATDARATIVMHERPGRAAARRGARKSRFLLRFGGFGSRRRGAVRNLRHHRAKLLRRLEH